MITPRSPHFTQVGVATGSWCPISAVGVQASFDCDRRPGPTDGAPACLERPLRSPTELRAARLLATTEAEQTALDRALADVVEGLFAGVEFPAVQGIATPKVNEPLPVQGTERPMSKHSRFYGLGLKEACPKLLSLIVSRTPQTAREIWEQLKAEGWTSAHHDPVHAVHDALRRRAKTHGDVLLVGGGKWGKTEWYTEAQLDERNQWVVWAVATGLTISSAPKSAARVRPSYFVA